MAIYKLRYGNEVRVIKNFFSERVATQRLVRDDSGAWFYRSEHSDIRVHAQDYAWLRDLANLEGFDCDDITLEVFTGCQNTRREVFNGIFTPRSVAFNHNRCLATMKPKTNDIYKCLYDTWEEEIDILAIPSQFTCKEQRTVYPYAGHDFMVEFTITDGQNFNNPTDPGYHTGNSIITVIDGNQYGIFWRFYRYVDCQAGSPEVFSESWLTTEDECAENGLTKVILETAFDGTPVPTNIDDFSASNFYTNTENIPTQPNTYFLSSIYANQFLFFIPPVNEVATFSNGRRLDKVLERLILDQCDGIESIRSELFRINPQDSTNICSDNGYSVDMYFRTIIYQITDVLFNDADQDATRGIMTLRGLLQDLWRLFRTAWRIEKDDQGNNVFRIEHESVFAEPVGNDLRNEASKYFATESIVDQLPIRQTFAALHQRSVDFVGKDIKYNGNCVGNETEVNQLSLFCTDYPYLRSNNDVEPPLDAFVMLQVYDVGIENYIGIHQGPLTGAFESNMAMSWSFLHNLFHKHEKPLRDFEMNGEPTTALSVLPTNRMTFNATSACDNSIEFEKLIQVSASKYMRVQSFSEKMKTCRATIEGDI